MCQCAAGWYYHKLGRSHATGRLHTATPGSPNVLHPRHLQSVTKTAAAPVISNTTGAFAFTSPRPSNLSSLAVNATDAAGMPMLCGVPVCSPTSFAALDTTVACTYTCAPGAWSVQAHVTVDGVTFRGSRRNATVVTLNDTASACASVSVPLFAAHAGATWSNPWVLCANGNHAAVTPAASPPAAACATFTNYSVTAAAAVWQSVTPGALLASANASVSYPCSVPTVNGSAFFTSTRSYAW